MRPEMLRVKGWVASITTGLTVATSNDKSADGVCAIALKPVHAEVIAMAQHTRNNLPATLLLNMDTLSFAQAIWDAVWECTELMDWFQSESLA